MKKILIFILYGFITYPVLAQQTAEAIIRNLENEEREAILKSDTGRLYQLMSSKIVVHNPENTIVNFRQIMDRVEAGKINYASFERIIENVTFFNGTAIVMGKDVVIPKSTIGNAGKTVTRRFTNIWSHEDKGWKLIGRQSTIISIN